jgi:hypothetical protein
MCSCRDQLLAQKFDAVLAVIVKLAGDTIFAKFCRDAISHFLRHPRSIQTRDAVGMGWDGLGWVGMGWYGWRWLGMGGDGLGWGFGISWMGEEGCWERQLWPRNGFVDFPAPFFQHFESLWMGHGSSWVQIGFRLGTMAPQ